MKSHKSALNANTMKPIIGRLPLLAFTLFLIFLALFWCLPSHDYMAVDGATRCLSVYHDGNLMFHGNNHLLYPLWVSLWSRLVQAAGIRASNPFEFIRISQAMNGFLGAAAIAILYTILQLLVEYQIALLCSLVFGFSTALLLHATNSAEALAGLFFALLGVRVLMAGLRRNGWALMALAGICFGFALASYQAMGAIAGVAVFASLWWSSTRHEGRTFSGAPASLFWVALGGLFSVCGIYGFAYSRQSIPLAQMPRQFFSLTGSEVYSGFTVSNFVNVPFGLLRNLFDGLPPRYSGIRAMLRDPQRTFWIPAVLAGLATVGLVAYIVAKTLWRMFRKSRGLMLAALGAIALVCFPLVYWNPTYDKLWLLPLAVATTVVAVSFRPGFLHSGERKVLTTLLIVVLGTEIAVNLPPAFRSHLMATPHLADAEDVNRLIEPRDWIMLDFDNVSVLWLSFWGQNSKSLLLPASTTALATEWLTSAKQANQQNGARLLFIGVLDEDRKTWDAFLGHRVGIPFDLLDEYRTHTTVIRKYVSDHGTTTIREYR
jgi:hypothetical protein